MSKAKIRRYIWIGITLLVAVLYVLLNKDIVEVLDDSALNTQLSDVIKTKTKDLSDKVSQDKTIAKIKKETSGIFLDSTKEELITALGEPSKKETEFLNQWYYEESIIYFDSDDRVIGYNDLGELSESLNRYFELMVKQVVDYTFFIGSDKKDIMNLLGLPNSIDHLHPDVWKYNNSIIHFSMKDTVDGYMNYYGEIDKYLPKANNDQGEFMIGSSKDEVIGIMGAPNTIENYHPNIWIYKLAKVYFDDSGVVNQVDDSYGDLKFKK